MLSHPVCALQAPREQGKDKDRETPALKFMARTLSSEIKSSVSSQRFYFILSVGGKNG